MSGKGSRQRPTNYDNYSEGYDRIFGKREDNTGTNRNEYYDILSTEDCLIEDNNGISS
jgi:hypothetical protein